MNICLFSKEEVESGFNLKIKDDRANHILKILHKKEGDSFVAGVIDGMAGIATIQKIDQRRHCTAYMSWYKSYKKLDFLI